jgi:hypothetical protein
MLHIYKKSPITVLSHFYNEAWLLPHWLNHHSRLFDHGILVNYGSTDNSVDIIKKITPNWTIVDSKNKMFDAELCDLEMMEYERTVFGWKMILNTTEFMLTNDLKSKLRRLEMKNISMIRSIGYQINDSNNEEPFDNNKPIIFQRFNGHLDKWRFRIAHNHPDGGYHVGRHFDTPALKINSYTNKWHENIPISDDDLYTLWYRFAPFKEQLPRKIQISEKIPDSDRDKGFAWNHWKINEQILFSRWQSEIEHCDDIRKISGIYKEYEKVKEMYER